MEHNKEALLAEKECKEQGPKGRLSKLRARGERQLKERLSDFERKGETFPRFGGKCNKPGLFPRRISENSIPLSKFLKILLTTST